MPTSESMGVVQPLSAANSFEAGTIDVPGQEDIRQVEVGAIDEIVHDSARLNVWPKAIAHRYREASEEGLYREYRFLFILGFAVCIATISLDILVNPAMFDEGVILRLASTVPMTILGMIAGARRWSGILKLSLGASPLLFLLVLAHLSTHLPPQDAARYLLGAAMIAGISNITLPFSIRDLAIFNAAAIAAAFAGVGIGGWERIIEQSHNLIALTIIALATMPLATRVEGLRQRNFLLGLRTELVSAQLVDANEALRRLSDTDALTDVPNRRWFEHAFEQRVQDGAIGGNSQATVGLMMIDLDHFKPFNDKHGHQAGDSCLKLVARTLNEVFGDAGGLFARYGGEEFIAALRAENAAQIIAIAETARASVAATLANGSEGRQALITASIGLAIAPASALLPREELIEMADAALYSGKNAGRNRVVVVEAGPLDPAEPQLEPFG